MRILAFRHLPLVLALGFGPCWAATPSGTGTESPPNTAGSSVSPQPRGALNGNLQPHADKLSHADRKFIEDAAKGGIFEVQAGQLAQSKASDPAVKELGSRFVQDHTKANDELRRIAESKNVQLPSSDKWSNRHELSKLQKLNGSDFDREFAQHSVKDHEKDIKDFQKAAAKLKDPDIKAWAENQLPTLREHLAMAQKLPEGGKQQTAATNHASK